MGRSYVSILKMFSFLILVVGVILLIKNLDSFLFKNKLDLLNTFTAVFFVCSGTLGINSKRQLKKIKI